MSAVLLPLPPSTQEIADVIGREKALFLIGQLKPTPGRRWRICLYVPRRMPLDHWLVRLLGYQDAEALRREFGGIILQPGSCSHLVREFRNREVRRMAAEGMSHAEIADAVGLSSRHVRNLLAESPPEETPLAGAR